MKIYVDIDNTICSQVVGDYGKAEPWHDNIAKINKLYDEGNEIIYYTARGTVSKINWYDITKDQLDSWGCKYHDLITGTGKYPKPFYDMVIDDKAKRIEEL